MEGGADDFYVVTGYQSRCVHDFLSRLIDRLGVRITPIVNEDWKKGNGVSVLKAQKYLRGPFLLLMADHLFDPAIAHKLMKYPLADGEIILCVDGNTENSLYNDSDHQENGQNGEARLQQHFVQACLELHLHARGGKIDHQEPIVGLGRIMTGVALLPVGDRCHMAQQLNPGVLEKDGATRLSSAGGMALATTLFFPAVEASNVFPLRRETNHSR
jgi:hypothetical protein